MSSRFYLLFMDELKTSNEWYHEIRDEIKILDPDGWDRNRFHYSWFEEEITEEEFNKRLFASTVESKTKK
jgi:hypothetical protein